MRRRNVQASDEGDSKAAKALASLRRFDVYSKVDEDHLQKSQAGGTVTVVASVIIALLFILELREFFSVQVQDSVLVDTSWKKNLQISLNISFPKLRCDMVEVQAVDRAGEQEEVKGKFSQKSLDARGGVVYEHVPHVGDCLSCLEGASNDRKCCNSCQALKNAYYAAGKSYADVVRSEERCGASVGCRIEGQVWVPRRSLSGSVHLGVGHLTKQSGRLEPHFTVSDPNQAVDTSHTIHAVVFGEVDSNERSPLDGTSVTDHRMLHHHYNLRLVPTIIVDRWGRKVETTRVSQISTAKMTRTPSGKMVELPGAFLSYEMMPFRMQSIEKSKPWSYIFTSTCAIIGGAFSVASLVETGLSKFWSGSSGVL